jgi:hypothetical protein
VKSLPSQALGRCRGGFATKIYSLGDGKSNSLTAVLSPARDHQSKHLAAVMKSIQLTGLEHGDEHSDSIVPAKFAWFILATVEMALRIIEDQSKIVETCKALPLLDHRVCRDRRSVDYGYCHFFHKPERGFPLTLARSRAGVPEQVCQDFL